MNKILTILRFVASFLVVFYHFTYRYFERNDLNVIELFTFGSVGVEMFFLLSGYLLINSIEKYDSLRFLLKRIKRIYPTYIVGMFLTLLTLYLSKNRLYSISDVLANMFFLNIPLGIESIDGVYWTLFIEVCFYLMLFFLSMVSKRVPIVFICIAIITLVLRLAYVDTPIISILSIFSYGWLFASGAALRMYQNTQSWIYMFLGLALLLGYTSYAVIPLIESMILVLTYMIIHLSLRLKNIEMPRSMVFLGTISYPIYLIHQEIGYAIFDLLGWSWIVFFLSLVCIIFLGWLLHKYVEARFT